MAGKRDFSTAAIRVMEDTNLSGEDFRVYLWVSLHDGMSQLKRKGPGCFARNRTLFEKARCNYASGCRSLSKLVLRGHLVRERKGRTTVYRVNFASDDNLQDCNPSKDKTCDQPAPYQDAICCNENQQPSDNAIKSDAYYTTLSVELDAVETGGLDRQEKAICASTELVTSSNAIGVGGANAEQCVGDQSAKAKPISIYALLPNDYPSLPPATQLSLFETAFSSIGRDARRLSPTELRKLNELFRDHADYFSGKDAQISFHALRLLEELARI